ncbi:acyl-CoA carboxylase subunit epsilon [Streptomyces sp. NBC_00273]|uniref:acyl-CoA carboxylase subunit epsilon n=1 Tax=Streptomyces sp. NBC_00273 TaxID=2903644 RepID=UPI002E28BF26|nr:acyl-CoA carboxylase subunit epsilon [Streptomyces sp. NBC_00273]
MSASGHPVVRTPSTPALLTVVRGRPTPEELAAVTAVLLASAPLAHNGPQPGAPERARWARPADGPTPSWAAPAARHTWR